MLNYYSLPLLQIKIYVFTTVNWRSRAGKWIAYNPTFRKEECMAPTADYHCQLHHNRARNHFDRVVHCMSLQLKAACLRKDIGYTVYPMAHTVKYEMNICGPVGTVSCSIYS